MSDGKTRVYSHVTLGFGAVLHAFTHAYGTMLVPLYLMMQKDLGLRGVQAVALIVAVYGLVYCLLAYPAGMLADRMNRKVLLGVGLIGNAAAIGLMGVTGQYWVLIVLGAVAGAFGALFHPTANALMPAHYPKQPGMAIGILAIGAGLGFFAGPRYAGWRADVVGDGRWGLAAWQVPCLEMGIVGVVIGVLFLVLAREVAHEVVNGRRERRPMGAGMRRRVLGIAATLGWRDFAGVAQFSLLSIYLQKAHGYDTARTGWIVGVMMLISAVANPIGVWLTSGSKRLAGLTTVLVVGGAMLAAVPFISMAFLLPYLMVFQVFHLGSFAIGEAAMLERVDPGVRGRIIGVFLTTAGTVASTAPWVMGAWTDWLGERAYTVSGYYVPFAVLGGLMAFGALSAGIIARLGDTSELRAEDVVEAMVPAIEPTG